jgi:hypothetical protein
VSVKLVIEINGQEREIELPDEIARLLAAIAARNGLTVEDALTQAVTNEDLLETLQAEGGQLLIRKDDKLHVLDREPAGV